MWGESRGQRCRDGAIVLAVLLRWKLQPPTTKRCNARDARSALASLQLGTSWQDTVKLESERWCGASVLQPLSPAHPEQVLSPEGRRLLLHASGRSITMVPNSMLLVPFLNAAVPLMHLVSNAHSTSSIVLEAQRGMQGCTRALYRHDPIHCTRTTVRPGTAKRNTYRCAPTCCFHTCAKHLSDEVQVEGLQGWERPCWSHFATDTCACVQGQTMSPKRANMSAGMCCPHLQLVLQGLPVAPRQCLQMLQYAILTCSF
jgi:hypothetical protein